MQSLQKTDVKENEPLDRHTTWKVGGPADYYLVCGSEDDLVNVIKAAKGYSIPYFIIGKGSNLLVSDEGFKGFAIRLTGEFEAISVEGSIIEAGCGATLRSLSNAALKNGLSGLEFAHDIPGTLGAAIKLNAGAHGDDFSMIIKSVTLFDTENMGITAVTPEFGYRHSSIEDGQICLRAELSLTSDNNESVKNRISQLTEKRKSSQPTGFSAGSVFKNPDNDYAARLIEISGCKGLSINSARISERHANFIMNEGHAKAQDIVKLMQLVREKVYNTTGIVLETEIKTVGFVLDESPKLREQTKRT